MKAPYLGTRWSKDFLQCVECGKTNSEHQSRGRCNRCYSETRKEYKAKNYQKNKERTNALLRKRKGWKARQYIFICDECWREEKLSIVD